MRDCDDVYEESESQQVYAPILSHSSTFSSILKGGSPLSHPFNHKRDTTISMRTHIFGESCDEDSAKQSLSKADSRSSTPFEVKEERRQKEIMVGEREANQQDSIYHEDEDDKIGDTLESKQTPIPRAVVPTVRHPTLQVYGYNYLDPQPIPSEPRESIQSHKSKGIKKAKSERGQQEKKPGFPTKNMLAFFYTKFINFFDKKTDTKDIPEWNSLSAENASLTTMTRLFQMQCLREGFEQMFRCRYLHREVVASSAKINSKKTYIKFIGVLERGFKTRKLEYIH